MTGVQTCALPIFENTKEIYCLNEISINTKLLDFLARNDIVVSAFEVDKPKYARYCWTNYSEVTLFGKNGIPAAPFRTSCDDGAVATGSRNEGLWKNAEVD